MARRFFANAILVAVALVIVVPGTALAHLERPTTSPARPGSVPNLNRTHDVTIDVCKKPECAFHDVQAAVDSIPAGNTTNTLVRVWPGKYEELPSRAVVDNIPPDNPNGSFSYEFQLAHPNNTNLIAIVGKKNVTIRGMGASPHDVVIDANFSKHVGIRGDRSDGLILQNFSFYSAREHGVYILDSDGYVIDHVYSAYSQEYPFLTFADDHGLMQYCEAVGGGDGGVYPGGSADTPGRVSQEIRYCTSHHNVLGYSGTQGDHVWVHDSVFYDNTAGLVSDSETDHPNYPENNLTLERNLFYGNNFNTYSADADVAPVEFDEAGPGFNGVVIPVGVGIFLASGNNNLVQNNSIWDNARVGVWLASGEGLVVGPTSDPAAPPFASSGNRFIGNRMYAPAGMTGGFNGTDFGWDGAGVDNCWQDNVRSAGGAPATGSPAVLPPCHLVPGVVDAPPPVWVPNPQNALEQIGIARFNGRPMCDYLGMKPCTFGSGPAPGKAKNKPASDGGTTDRSFVPNPEPCGPSTCATAASGTVRGVKLAGASGPALAATGVGTPTALAVALLIGAAVGSATLLIRRRVR